MQYQTVILVDGENLVARFECMKKSGRIPKQDTLHIENCFVWNENITKNGSIDIVRVAYYTTGVGDDDKIKLIKETVSIAPFKFKLLSGQEWGGTLVPYVYKKQKRGTTTKSVDINLTIDALRYAYGSSIQQFVIVTGDGDYIPVLREVMARGKMVQVWALSDGLNPEIKHHVDDLVLLDNYLFESVEITENSKGISN